MAKLNKCKDCGHEVSKSAKKCPNCGKPQSGGKLLGCGPFTWLLISAVVLMVVLGRSVSKPGETFYNKPSSKEITLTESAKKDVAVAIQEAGFNCPAVKIVYAKGEDAYGAVTKIFCGPVGQEGVYEKAVFKMTLLKNDTTKIEPWK